jgi:hypothetical protein
MINIDLFWQVLEYFGLQSDKDISHAFIRAAISSVARTAMFSLQDVLQLDNSARMNTPAVQVLPFFISFFIAFVLSPLYIAFSYVLFFPQDKAAEPL